MSHFARLFYILIFTVTALFSSCLQAQDNARMWPVIVKNHINKPIHYIARFSDWYTLDDILQVQSTKRRSLNNNSNNIIGAIAAKATFDHILNIWFRSYPNSQVTSMQVVQFYISIKLINILINLKENMMMNLTKSMMMVFFCPLCKLKFQNWKKMDQTVVIF